MDLKELLLGQGCRESPCPPLRLALLEGLALSLSTKWPGLATPRPQLS